MASDSCDGCGRDVPIAGGIANLWSFESDQTGGVTVELEDGTDHFLCFECTSKLPDDATTADVEAIEPYDPEEDEDDETQTATDDGGAGSVGVGLVLGAGLGVALGVALGDLDAWLPVGLGIGLAVGLLWDRV